MGSALRDPPAAARVAQELLEALRARAAGADAEQLDRLRLLVLRLLETRADARAGCASVAALAARLAAAQTGGDALRRSVDALEAASPDAAEASEACDESARAADRRGGTIPARELSEGPGGRHEWLGARVALVDAPEGVDARALSRLEHPHVLRVLGASARADGRRVLVCEPLAACGSLLGLMAARAAAGSDSDADAAGTPRFVWRALHQAALALKFLHRRGLARGGGLACAQILVGPDGSARVAAFDPAAAPGEPRGRAWGPADDVRALGRCVLEAAEQWQRLMASEAETETETEAETEAEADPECEPPTPRKAPTRTPADEPRRPRRGLSDAQWALADAMCVADAGRCMDMADVAHRLERFASPGSSSEAPPPETRPEAQLLRELQALAGPADEDARALADLVLRRLLDIRARLEAWAAERAGADDSDRILASGAFRDVLGRVHALAEAQAAPAPGWAADYAAELELLCASRTVGADEHCGFHAALDQLLRRHARLGAGAAVHDWKPRWAELSRRLAARAKQQLLQAQHSLRCDHDRDHDRDRDHDHDRNHDHDRDRDGLSRRASDPDRQPPRPEDDTPEWFTPPGEVLFNAEQPFSEGAFGSAHHGSWLDARVVVKRIKAGGAADSARDAAFQREVGIWHALRHPHVVGLFGASVSAAERFFVCEFAAQGELSGFLDAVGARDGPAARVAAAWDKLLQAALGLRFLHARGVLHQDLKCNNILVGADGVAKLSDFGLSARLSDMGPAARVRDLVRTGRFRELLRAHAGRGRGDKARSAVGAPRWKAPEVLAGHAPSVQSDVYALGMCVLEAVSGELPWGPDLPDAAVKFLVKQGKLPSRNVVRFSPAECALVKEMCQAERTARPPLARVVKMLAAIAQKHRVVAERGAAAAGGAVVGSRGSVSASAG